MYGRIAPHYTDIARKAHYTAPFIMSREACRYVKSKQANVLDLGCGTGLSAERFLKKNWTVTGIDISEHMLYQAKQLPFDRLQCADLDSASFKPQPDAFDVAVAVGVMEFIQHPESLLQKINRALKPNGVLAITFPKRLKLAKMLPINMYSSSECRALLKRSRFQTIKAFEILGYENKASNLDARVQYLAFIARAKRSDSDLRISARLP